MLPERPAGTEGMTEAQLAEVVEIDCRVHDALTQLAEGMRGA